MNDRPLSEAELLEGLCSAPEVEVWGIHHPIEGFRFRGVCVSTDIEDAIAWANAENILEDTDKWKARKFRLSVNQPPASTEARKP